jgi:2-haloacid dehalogenase
MSAEKYDIVRTPPKALLFDVFGTVVDWRTSLTEALVTAAETKLKVGNITPELHAHVGNFDNEKWGRFAQDWRDDYLKYAQDYRPESQNFQSVDSHWRLSLQDLLVRYNLEGFYNEDELQGLIGSWHCLKPWPDTTVGMQMLGQNMITCTLSDGHHAVLRDLDAFGDLHFQKFLSSEDFQAYKPHPSVYLGAAKRLGLEPNECCMVAAHLRDLDGISP